MNGQNTTLMSMRLRRVIWQRTIPHSFAVMMTEVMRFFQEFRQAAGGTPEDMQGAVVWLASKASDYVNGYTVAVDGGWLAR